MDIKTMKNAAKAAARAKGTSHQEELNHLARVAGFTHWGALVAAQPNPSFGYRYNPQDQQNARDLQQARNDNVHILYVAEDRRIAIGHVIGMANSTAMLPTPKQAQDRLIARPPAAAVVEGDLTRDWKDMPTITPDGIAEMPRGAVVYVERLEWRHVQVAHGTGVILVGAVTPDMTDGWPEGGGNEFLTLFIPTQDDGQIGRIYSKEDQEVIYATTAVKYVLPERDGNIVSLRQGEVGATTIRRRSGRPSASRSNPNSLWADDYVRPGDIAKRAKSAKRKG
jgi:hypothetical protein